MGQCASHQNMKRNSNTSRPRLQSVSLIAGEGKKKSLPLLANTPQSHRQPTAQKEKRNALTSILAHVDLLFKNITEALTGIEKV